MKIQIYFETSSEGGYTCFVPSLPDEFLYRFAL